MATRTDRNKKKSKYGSFKEKARQAAKQREGRYAWWLNNNNIFDQSFLLCEEYKAAAEKVFKLLAIDGYKIEEKYHDFEILLANLLFERAEPVSISLNINDWGKSRYRYTSYFMVQLVNIMQENGLIETSGFYYKPEGNGRMTRIWATNLLLEHFPVLPYGIGYKPVELVELRNDKHKLIEYQDTTETDRIKKILKNANLVNEKASIFYKEYRLSAFLVAIFQENFSLYGRLHTRGSRHYQGMPKDERKEITINGDPVVELDYSGLHPRLLYASEKIQYDGDPYTEVYKDATSGTIRSFLKVILLCMLNSKDKVSAEKAANNWINFEYAEISRLKKRLEKEKITENYFQKRTVALHQKYADRRELKQEIMKAGPVIDAFKKAHEPIAHHFCSGKKTGLKLMNRDSKIALAVVKHFTKQGIPILVVHDSFVVQRQFRDELKKEMHEIYRKHNDGFTCPIK